MRFRGKSLRPKIPVAVMAGVGDGGRFAFGSILRGFPHGIVLSLSGEASGTGGTPSSFSRLPVFTAAIFQRYVIRVMRDGGVGGMLPVPRGKDEAASPSKGNRKMAYQRLEARSGRHGSGGAEPEAVRVWLLGGFSVSVGTREIGEGAWRRRKAGSLVKLLALARGHRLHRERVLDLLWPDLDAKRAGNNLHRVLHFARRALEPALLGASAHLRLRDGWILLCPDGSLRVDVEAFEDAAANAHRSREPAAYRAAIDLYSGDLLPESRYEAWTEERRRELRTTYLTLLVESASLHEERGELDEGWS